MKTWGTKEYWGCGSEFDPDWMLNERQLKLRDALIELCRTDIRPHAATNDADYVFPRQSLNALSRLGLLGLVVPAELGGMGENHSCTAMVLETLARYGCPSTALTYCMHLTACSMLLYRCSTASDTVKTLLREMNEKKLIGTSVHSDPATGGHFWYPLSSKVKRIGDNMLRVLKYGSWATSAGHADWYAINTLSPDCDGNHSSLVSLLCMKGEVRAFNDEWRAMGMHGNMSGQLVVDCKLSTDRLVCPVGEGGMNNDEAAAPTFFITSSAVWNGIALACMDVAKKHVTRTTHGDVGLRVADYACVQDYFGSSLCSTNSCRLALFAMAQQVDSVSHNNNWMLTSEAKTMPRSPYNFWLWQNKHNCSENVSNVADAMLRATGGTGYKTDLGLERLFRDGKAGCLMALNNELVRNFLGQALLDGPQTLDFWHQRPNRRVVNQEIVKMSAEEKQQLAKTLLEEAEAELKPVKVTGQAAHDDFDNPFSTGPPVYLGKNFSEKGSSKTSALCPDGWTKFPLNIRQVLNPHMDMLQFSYPSQANHSGLIPGQYIQVRVSSADGSVVQERFMSPVSVPADQSHLSLIIRYESQGILSEQFRLLAKGSNLEIKGPSGGFEYIPNILKEMTMLASGGGLTPCLQLIRSSLASESDTTKLNLLYYCDRPDDFIYKDELDALAKGTDGRFRVCYSVGEAEKSEWLGEEGFIDAPMIHKHVTIDASDDHKIILCGGPSMSLSCCFALRSLGFTSQQVFIYGHFGAEQIKRAYGKQAALATNTC